MKKILFVFGTRPEAIKLAPVIAAGRASNNLKVSICVTAQHRELLDEVLNVFNIIPDYDLNIMVPNQSLFYSTSHILIGLENVMKKELPDLVLVQGDTTTTFVASLSAYYLGIKVAHIEAGLRTEMKNEPFPEEMNRRCVSVLADFHFAPTPHAKMNLLKEGVKEDNIFVTGNTIVDALSYMLPIARKKKISEISPVLEKEKRKILVTAHRRENFGDGIKNICLGIKKLSEENKDIQFIFPVHPNPNVTESVKKILDGNNNRVITIKPLDYLSFLRLMDSCYLFISDSGGIQEEAPSLRKPILILRNVTERPEVVEAGLGKIVGTDCEQIVREAQILIDNPDAYAKMQSNVNPFGDGHAAEKIIDLIYRI
jgi:UDP-N-acetylglucosamine 2-epimerase (non-hydrolysing)